LLQAIDRHHMTDMSVELAVVPDCRPDNAPALSLG